MNWFLDDTGDDCEAPAAEAAAHNVYESARSACVGPVTKGLCSVFSQSCWRRLH